MPKISFRDYLSYAAYNGKRNYAKNSVKMYVEGMPAYFFSHYQVDILQLTDPVEVGIFYQSLKNDEDFNRDNLASNKAYSCGLERYIEYLRKSD